MRTTSSLESYNAALGRKFPVKGNFFRFVKLIADEEFIKSRDMRDAVDSGGSSTRKRKVNERDQLIKEAVAELRDDKLTVMQFLSRVTFERNKIVTDMAHFEVPIGYQSENEYSDEEEEQNNTEGDRKTSTSTELHSLCVVCKVNQPDIVFLPCRHLKNCNTCYLTLERNLGENEKVQCPYCKERVEDTIAVFV